MKDQRHPRPSHPAEEQLLLLLDGELPSREASEVQAHLRLCWECRSKTQKLKKGIYAFVDYTQERFMPSIGVPPGGWSGFGPMLDDASSTQVSRKSVLCMWLNRRRQMLASAAVAAGVAAILVI